MTSKPRRSKAVPPVWPEQERRNPQSLKCHRYVGISLGGGKSDRTAFTVLEYYGGLKKLIVNRVMDRLKSEGELSADLRLHESIQQYKSDIHSVAIDVPLTLPKCFRCDLPCPGYEVCDEEEIRWLWKQHRAALQKNKKTKLFTPYTRRCAEVYWSSELEDLGGIGDALGANQSPLMARGRFLIRRWDCSVIEVLPRLSLQRWAIKEKVSRTQLRGYRHSVDGDSAREYLLKTLCESLGLFIYEQDRQIFMDNLVAFDSLWVALTAFWKDQKLTESAPRSFPREEGWIEVPKF